MNHNQIIEAWNAQADEHNQWGALGENEKVEFAFAIGAAESKAEIERLKSEAELFAKHTGLTLAAKDALLRQTLGVLNFYIHESGIKERNDPHYTNEDRDAWDTAAAIKQHLGDV